MSVREPSKDRGGLGPAVAASLRSPGFVVCVVALGLLTAVFYGSTRNVQFRKLAAPLRLSLADLDKTALKPYACVDAYQIPAEVIDSLGTKEYIQWKLADNDEPESSPVRQAVLFVTFYTGQPDPVPHVPENCYLGSGYLVSANEDWNVDIPALERKIPARVLELEKKGRLGSERPIVMYTFGVNGRFAADRNEVRQIVGAPWEAYAYFSKVEVRFQSPAGALPTRPEAMAAAEKLFRVVLPILVEKHWPDWKALHEQNGSTTKQVK